MKADFEGWKKEFMPVAAWDCPKEKAVDHSLLKYIGLRKENLYRYGLVLHGPRIFEKDSGGGKHVCKLTRGNCTLCQHYKCKAEGGDCPLGACTCCQEHWRAITDRSDPEPMIAALLRIMLLAEKKGKEQTTNNKMKRTKQALRWYEEYAQNVDTLPPLTTEEWKELADLLHEVNNRDDKKEPEKPKKGIKKVEVVEREYDWEIKAIASNGISWFLLAIPKNGGRILRCHGVGEDTGLPLDEDGRVMF